jgi:hypothetical protein
MTNLAPLSMASSEAVSMPLTLHEPAQSLTQDRVAATDSLLEVMYDAISDGWDGNGGDCMTEQACGVAYQFLQALPPWSVDPEISVTPRGNVAMEWYVTPQRRLGLTLDANGEVAYAAFLGWERKRGTSFFSGRIPGELLALLRRVTG